ncbi:hypothetical protein K438DRAFT_1836056 [Mycena galopus ATCC 62051]|nr:hypothetical protein K438DRAFT_1836056 [Mycena galopus ATCC 62051]
MISDHPPKRPSNMYLPTQNLRPGGTSNSDSHTGLEVDESSDSGSEQAQAAKSSKRPRNQNALGRWARALCRVLVQRHDIPQSSLRDYFSCAQSTISKAVGNHYAEPDNTQDDQKILSADPDFDDILKKFLKKKDRSEAKKSRGFEHPYCQPARRRSRAEPHTVDSSSKSKAPSLRSGEAGSVSDPSTSKSLSPLAKAHHTTAVPRPFLMAFVANVPLDAVWYGKLKSAGFNEEKLRVFSRLEKDQIYEFIEERLGEMNHVDRFLLVAAIKKLAIAS